MVPASTIETYMMALRGEYCMATVSEPIEQGFEPLFELLPAGVLVFLAGEGVELAGLDAVD